ncbi:hypothetical protein CCH79_00018015, partial [Gambusia affinis]
MGWAAGLAWRDCHGNHTPLPCFHLKPAIFCPFEITRTNVGCQSQQSNAMTLLTYLRNAIRLP